MILAAVAACWPHAQPVERFLLLPFSPFARACHCTPSQPHTVPHLPFPALSSRAKPEAEINAPVGADAHGFCFASKGRRFHQGNRMDYGAEARPSAALALPASFASFAQNVSVAALTKRSCLPTRLAVQGGRRDWVLHQPAAEPAGAVSFICAKRIPFQPKPQRSAHLKSLRDATAR